MRRKSTVCIARQMVFRHCNTFVVKKKALPKLNTANNFRPFMLNISLNGRPSSADEPAHHPRQQKFIHEYLQEHFIELDLT
ncbi:hypothetical protein T265_04242 [Opisthorchis viverrini]|uniref:Uncharacterized protein n=1 Tax=Opisthorchis viverrini TaxID=6198 RepID=A0A074ZPM3_OPIVI|nr:hypothetical protein T265_04242 [Opisthorchis viverrini]KER29056.1 hypothetical protein T265_04242 [Opisthorchis viverrini]